MVYASLAMPYTRSPHFTTPMIGLAAVLPGVASISDEKPLDICILIY